MDKTLKYTCLFSHYNASENIDDYVVTYLSSLYKLCFQIIFISNSLVNVEQTVLLTSRFPGIRILIRENQGFDFGGWSQAMREGMVPEDSDYLVLANDSVFGPLYDLTIIFHSMNSDENVDFWGMTDNYQNEWHIQSFCMCFSKKVYTSEAFKDVFRQNFNGEKKSNIIKKGEVLLTRSLTEHGFKGQAYIPYSTIEKDTSSLFALNVTHFFWDLLITKYNFPFIKRDLVLQNPENLQNLEDLFPLIRQVSTYDIENIKTAIVRNNSIRRHSNDDARISVLCHMYYPHSIYYFLSKLAVLKKYKTSFYFNVADTLSENQDFIEILEKSFPRSVIMYAPDKGRDIGGKFSLLDLMLKIQSASDYTLFIHDKFSAHTPTGKEWRDKLFKIIDEKELPGIMTHFRNNPKTGLIGARDFIKNEYNPDKNGFDCTSSLILLQKLEEYKLKPDNFNFVAGSIFWIRSEILKKFFSRYKPLSVRKEFESGNALDFANGTIIHSWERLFSMIVSSEHYKLKGI